jgi:hypothetical protein
VHAARGDYAQAVIVLESALADLGTASDGDDEVRDTLEGDIRRIAAKLN